MCKSEDAKTRDIQALRDMKDSEIDTTDIPLTLDWSKAIAGRFYAHREGDVDPNPH